MPLDVALVWGPIADPAVLSHLKLHLSSEVRELLVLRRHPCRRCGQASVAHRQQPPHPRERGSGRYLARIPIGDLVTLRGKLVDVDIHDANGKQVFIARTSLSRTDVGSGACEIIWVESAEVGRDDRPGLSFSSAAGSAPGACPSSARQHLIQGAQHYRL